MAAPPSDRPWDDRAAAGLVAPAEVTTTIEAYIEAFIDGMPASPGAGAVLEMLATRGYHLAIVSNWPLAAAIDRYVDAAGWRGWLMAVVVSERVGTIKPYPAIFATARQALGDPAPRELLHVGDDWAADVEGARAAGWLVAHLAGRPADSPLPGSERPAGAEPDLELARLEDLPAFLPGVPHAPDAKGAAETRHRHRPHGTA
jgi:HAD superfamily hydrolase (TIGR01509 family)